MSAAMDLTGQRFGKLVVLARDTAATGRPRWICRCDCGNETAARTQALRSGDTKSCGCYHRARASEANTTHGESRATPEYQTWCRIIARCENPTAKRFDRYGGRGIKMCPRWRESFEAFLFDMGRRPSSRHSIERTDNNGNYEPGNCCWATWVEQGRNKSNNVLLTARGQTKILAEWAREAGIPGKRLAARINMGWDHERAIFAPVVVGRPRREAA